MAVGHQLQCLVESLFDRSKFSVQPCQRSIRGCHLLGDPLLLPLQLVEWDGSGVVRLKQFVSLTIKSSQDLRLPLGFSGLLYLRPLNQ